MDAAPVTKREDGKGAPTGASSSPTGASATVPGITTADKVAAWLEQQADRGVPGYRRGQGTGLTETPIKTVELCSWLQVPAILQELQLATTNGKQVDIRLLFPEPSTRDNNAHAIKATQAEIKQFLRGFHSKSAGEMYQELSKKLGELETTGALPKDLTAKDWLVQFKSLQNDNKSVLSVTDVIDLKSNPAALASKESLITTLTDAARVAGDRKVAIVVDSPSKEAAALAAALREPGVEISKLKNVRVWVGSLDYDADRSKGKKLEELTLEDFLKRIPPKETIKEEAAKKDSSREGGAPATDSKKSKDGGDTDPPSGGGSGGLGIVPAGAGTGATNPAQQTNGVQPDGVSATRSNGAAVELGAIGDPEIEAARAAQRKLVEDSYRDDPSRLTRELKGIDEAFDALAALRQSLAQRLAAPINPPTGEVSGSATETQTQPGVVSAGPVDSLQLTLTPVVAPASSQPASPEVAGAASSTVPDIDVSTAPAAGGALASLAAPSEGVGPTAPPAPVASAGKTDALSAHAELAAVSPAFFTSSPSTGAPAIKSYDLRTGELVLKISEKEEQRVVFPTAAGMELTILDGRFLVVSFRNPTDASKSMECDPPFNADGASQSAYQKFVFDIGRIDSHSKVPVIAVPSSGSPVSYMSKLSELASRIQVAYLSSVAAQYPDRLEAVTGFTKYASDHGSSMLFRHPEGVDLAGSGWHGVCTIEQRAEGGLLVTERHASGSRLWHVTLNGENQTYSAKRLQS